MADSRKRKKPDGASADEGAASAEPRPSRQQGFPCLHGAWCKCEDFLDPVIAVIFDHVACTCTQEETGIKCDKGKMMLCRSCPVSRLPLEGNSTVVKECKKPKKAHVDTRWCNPAAARTPADVLRNGQCHVTAARGWHAFWAACATLAMLKFPPSNQNGVEQLLINVRQCYHFLDTVKTVYKDGGMLLVYDNQAKFDNAEKVAKFYAKQLLHLPKYTKRVTRKAGEAGEAGEEQSFNLKLLADVAVSVHASEASEASEAGAAVGGEVRQLPPK